MLHPSLHALYTDAETKASKSAKFAKAIDKITPDIFDYLTPPDITIPRYKHFVGVDADQIIDTIIKFKRPYVEWNPFMLEFHTYLLERLSEKLSNYGNANS